MTPDGSEPAVMVKVPVPATLKVPAAPTVKVVVAALVICGRLAAVTELLAEATMPPPTGAV